MSIIKKFFDTVDFKNIKTRGEPKLIFLCGGTKTDTDKKTDTDTKTDEYFRPDIHKGLISNKLKVVLAEDVMNWQVSQEFGKDLLELEKYIAAIVSVIPIVCESPGSIAELGAFVSHEQIKKKLYIIIAEHYYNSKSFIRLGPIKNHEDNLSCTAYSFNHDNRKNHVDAICDDLEKWEVPTSTCDFSDTYFHIFLLMDIINILSVATLTEIRNAMSYALGLAGEKSLDGFTQIKEMLVVLVALKLIKKRTSGQTTYYIVKGKEFYLDYSPKNSNYYKKNSHFKKEVINEIYLNDKHPAFLLRDEIKKGDIEWLKKSDLTQLKKVEHDNLVKKAPLLYKVYDIPKKGKGTRTIAQPTHELKLLQSEAFKKLQKERKLPVHRCAKAYIKGVNGILINAEAHKDSKFFLKYDFKDFFPSIKAADFNIQLKNAGYNEQDRIDFLRIFFRFDKSVQKRDLQNFYSTLYNKNSGLHNKKDNNPALLKLMIEDYKNEFQLSIGAPSSPFISNTIMFDFDTRMDDWAKENDFIYTRFADDITISCQTKQDTGTITAKLNETLKDLKYPTLQLNDSKQKSVSLKNRVTITGLNITSEHKVSLGREKKKEIRAMIHHYKEKRPLKYKMSQLRGWLAYAHAVDNEFFKSMENKYTKELISSIIKTKS